MAKRSRVNAKTKEWRPAVAADDEKTQPHLRLVNKDSQPRISMGKDALALQALREQQRAETVLASWLPLVFGGMLALGFVYVNSAKNAVASKFGVSAHAKAQSNPYVTPLLQSARKLTAKK